MKVDLTEEMIEMEPGPNLYLMGSMPDCKKIERVFISLSEAGNKTIALESIFHELESFLPKVILKSKDNGMILSEVKKDGVTIELSSQLWRQIAKMIKPLTERKGHVYLDFDGLDLKEECNVIISSEW